MTDKKKVAYCNRIEGTTASREKRDPSTLTKSTEMARATYLAELVYVGFWAVRDKTEKALLTPLR